MKKFIEDRFDYKEINKATHNANKILKLLYTFMILIGVYLVTVLLKEWHLGTLLGGLFKTLTPFFIGFLLAWLLNPLVTYLEGKHIRKGISITAIYLIIIAVFYFFFAAFMPIILDQIKILASQLPAIGTSLNEWLTGFLSRFSNVIDVSQVRGSINDQVLSLATDLGKDVPLLVVRSMSSLFFIIISIVIGMMVGFYLLLDYRGVSRYLMRVIPKKHHEDWKKLFPLIDKQLYSYVRGLLLVLLVLFFVCWILYSIIGLKAALLIAFICTITDIVPYIGPFVGGTVAVLMGLSESLTLGIITIVIVIVIQQLESNVLQPLIMGKMMELHPVTIIVGLLTFGYFFGILGMIFATPIISVGKIVFNYYDEKYSLLVKEEKV